MPDHHRYTGARRGAALVAVTALGLVAIIGSGGGGGGSAAPTAEPLTITAANAGDVAALVITTSMSSFALADAGGGSVSASAAPVGGAGVAMMRLVPRTRRQILAAAQPAARVGPVTEPCAVAGTVRLSGDVANPDVLTVGDRITAVFNDCDDGDGEVLDGQLALVIRTIQGNLYTDVYLLAADATLTSLVLTTATETLSASGSFRLTEDSLAFPVVTTRVAGSNVELRAGGDVLTLTNFDEVVTTETSILPFSQAATVAGTLASRVLGGRVDYRTTATLQGVEGDAPDSGEILITGAGNTRIRLTVVDKATVNLDLDLDGNGTVDEVQVTTWGELGGDVAPGITASTAVPVAREALAVAGELQVTLRDAGAQFGPDGAFGRASSLVTVPGTFGPVFPLCQLGSVTVTGQIAVPGVITAGDRYEGTFNDCYQASPPGQYPIGSIVLNGQLATEVAGYTGFGGFYTVDFTGSATAFNGATGPLTATYSRPDPASISADGGTTNLQFRGGTAPRAAVNATASVQYDVFVSPTRITRSIGGNFYTAVIAGRYAVETVIPLASSGMQNPDTGEIRVTADNGSSLRIVALSDLAVRLDLDLDGNGSTDQVINSTWAALGI